MADNTQPEALRLAEEISNLACSSEAAAKTIAAAADELCRLHAENASLRAQQPASPPAEQTVDPDGEAFRTAARLGLTLRFYGACAQSSMPGTPSAYVVTHGGDRAEAMREAVEKAAAIIASGGEAPKAPLAPPAEQQAATESALGGVYAELPAPNYPKSGGFPGTFTEVQMRDFADRTHALRMQPAAPKAEPGEPSAFPMTGDEEESDLGQWQPGTTKPNMDGTYLREFDEGEATSEFHQGVWLRDGFFPSDLQDVRWRGRAAPQQEAQEPAAYIHVPHHTVEGQVRPVVSFEKYQQDYADGIYSTRIPLYTAPQPAPAPLSECLRLLNSFEYEGDEDSQAKAFFKAHINEDWFFHVKNSLELALAAQGGKV